MAVHRSAFHPVTGKNHYCGPTALAAFTGLSTDEITRIVRSEFPHRAAVKGMRNSEVIRVVQRLGGTARYSRVTSTYLGGGRSKRPTLKQWLDRHAEQFRGRMLVVECTGHYVAVSGEMVLCSVQRREKRHYLSAAYADKQVRGFIEITLPAKVQRPPAARKPRDVHRSARDRAKALAGDLQVNIEPTGWTRSEFELRPEHNAHWRPLAEAAIEAEGVKCWEGVMRQWCGDVTLLDGWDEVLRALQALQAAIDDALLKALDTSDKMP